MARETHSLTVHQVAACILDSGNLHKVCGTVQDLSVDSSDAEVMQDGMQY